MHLEATLHHQGQTVCSVLGGRPHVIEMVTGGINISCWRGVDGEQGVSIQCGSRSAMCRARSRRLDPKKPGGGGGVRGGRLPTAYRVDRLVLGS
jgi:hypothetical protein